MAGHTDKTPEKGRESSAYRRTLEKIVQMDRAHEDGRFKAFVIQKKRRRFKTDGMHQITDPSTDVTILESKHEILQERLLYQELMLQKTKDEIESVRVHIQMAKATRATTSHHNDDWHLE